MSGNEQSRPPSRRLSYVSEHNYDELLELGLCSTCGEGYHSGPCNFPRKNENDTCVNLKCNEKEDTKRDDKEPPSTNIKPAAQQPITAQERESYQELLKLGTQTICERPPFEFNKAKGLRGNEKQADVGQSHDVLHKLGRGFVEESASTINSISIVSENASEMVHMALLHSMPANELTSKSSVEPVGKEIGEKMFSSMIHLSQINSEEVKVTKKDQAAARLTTTTESIIPMKEIVSTTSECKPLKEDKDFDDNIEQTKVEDAMNKEEEEEESDIGAKDSVVEIEPVPSTRNVELGTTFEVAVTHEDVTTSYSKVENREHVFPDDSALMSLTQLQKHPIHLKFKTDEEIEVSCTKTSKHTVECTVGTMPIIPPTTIRSEMVGTSDGEIAVTVIKDSAPVAYSVSGLSTTHTATPSSQNNLETFPSTAIDNTSKLHEQELAQNIQKSEDERILASNSQPKATNPNPEEDVLKPIQETSVSELIRETSIQEPIQETSVSKLIEKTTVSAQPTRETFVPKSNQEIPVVPESNEETTIPEITQETTVTQPRSSHRIPENKKSEEINNQHKEAINEAEMDISHTITQDLKNVESVHNAPEEQQLEQVFMQSGEGEQSNISMVTNASDNPEHEQDVISVLEADPPTIQSTQNLQQNESITHHDISKPIVTPPIAKPSVKPSVISDPTAMPSASKHSAISAPTAKPSVISPLSVKPSVISDPTAKSSAISAPPAKPSVIPPPTVKPSVISTPTAMPSKPSVTSPIAKPSSVTFKPSLVTAAHDEENRESEQMSIEKLANKSDDITVLVEYNTANFESSHTGMEDESLSVRTSYLMSKRASEEATPTKIDESTSVGSSFSMSKTPSGPAAEASTYIEETTSVGSSFLLSKTSSGPVAEAPTNIDESLSVRTSYLMSKESSEQKEHPTMDESMSVKTSYLMSKRSLEQLASTNMDESVSVRTSYLLSKRSSSTKEAGPPDDDHDGDEDIEDSFSIEMDTMVEQPISISNPNLEPDNVPTLQPITTDVFDTLAPSAAIEIRPVEHHNSPAGQSDTLSMGQHDSAIMEEVTEEQATESVQPTKQPSRRSTKESQNPRHRRKKKGEGFLDLEYSLPTTQETVSVVTFYETTSASEVSGGEFENEEEKEELRSRIIEQAEEIKRLVSEKRMGLPQVHSDHILSIANEIISNHTKSASIFESDTLAEERKSRKSKRKVDKTSRSARSIINIADRSEGILDKFKTTKEYKEQVPPGEATDHLTKMIKKLHCRHRRLRRLAEEIIAKRWKLLNFGSAPPKQSEGKSESKSKKKSSSKAQKELRKRARRKKKGKSMQPRGNNPQLETLYTNPMVRVKEVGVRSGKETWKESDPLWKVVNKVGIKRVEKCSPNTVPAIQVDEVDSELSTNKEQNKKKRLSNKPSNPDFHNMSAMSIFRSNFSKVTVGPGKTAVFDKDGDVCRVGSIRVFNVDSSNLTNNFVDQWKRRSYGIGILSVILTALTHSAYVCGPRMGDNYVSYTMTAALSGAFYLAPTGIYGIIFLGYLFGGMAIIKTAAATPHSMSVKEYYTKRKRKCIAWYALSLYYFWIWIIRTIFWFTGLEKAETAIRNIFRNTVYYSQLPSRLLYTQFLFSCCGADGPVDYPMAEKIGYPKSCFVGIKKYEDYYSSPNPVSNGCVVEVYKYSTYAMAVICGLTLMVWMLCMIHPIYFYVYELYISIKTKELDPWVEEVKDDNAGFVFWKRKIKPVKKEA